LALAEPAISAGVEDEGRPESFCGSRTISPVDSDLEMRHAPPDVDFVNFIHAAGGLSRRSDEDGLRVLETPFSAISLRCCSILDGLADHDFVPFAERIILEAASRIHFGVGNCNADKAGLDVAIEGIGFPRLSCSSMG